MVIGIIIHIYGNRLGLNLNISCKIAAHLCLTLQKVKSERTYCSQLIALVIYKGKFCFLSKKKTLKIRNMPIVLLWPGHWTPKAVTYDDELMMIGILNYKCMEAIM